MSRSRAQADKTSAFDSQYEIARQFRDHVPVRSCSHTNMILYDAVCPVFRQDIFIIFYVT